MKAPTTLTLPVQDALDAFTASRKAFSTAISGGKGHEAVDQAFEACKGAYRALWEAAGNNRKVVVEALKSVGVYREG